MDEKRGKIPLIGWVNFFSRRGAIYISVEELTFDDGFEVESTYYFSQEF